MAEPPYQFEDYRESENVKNKIKLDWVAEVVEVSEIEASGCEAYLRYEITKEAYFFKQQEEPAIYFRTMIY